MSVSKNLLRFADAIRIADECVPFGLGVTDLVTASVANQREHFGTKATRAKRHRGVGYLLARRALSGCDWREGILGREPNLRLTVLLTRVAPRALDDDNAASALKALRDGVADFLGVDDRDARVTWLVDQRKGKPSVELQVFRGPVLP